MSGLKPVFLCVDDESIILNSLEAQLHRNFGPAYQYEFAESAEEAFEIIDELVDDDTPVILIISDWLMPKMKGDEFLIKIHQRHPRIVKIMLTGQADIDAVERAVKKADLFKCLSKPWSEKDLINTIYDGMKKLKGEKQYGTEK